MIFEPKIGKLRVAVFKYKNTHYIIIWINPSADSFYCRLITVLNN